MASEELPISDLYNPNKPKLFGIHFDGQIIGIVGIEAYENTGLLRSLVVSKASRKMGCGKKLVAEAEIWACEEGIKSLYLLTTSAANFFSRIGYEVVPRSQAPASIASTAQFIGLCPASATFMCKTFLLA